jgi:PST family polysaccharide transporter/lipopolysaccharide exporter
VVYFDKDLEFHKRFLLQTSQSLAEVAVSIGLALALRNVWALVYGVLAGQAVALVMSFLLHEYRPRPRLDVARIKEMHRFGRWISMGSILFFIANRADSAVIGKLLGPAALGAYEMGHRIAELATREVTTVSNIVSFPLFSKLQKSTKVKRAFLLSLDLVTSITWPVTVGVFLLATPLVVFLLGEQWRAVASILPALTAAGALRAMSATGGALYQGMGRPDYDLKQSIMRIVVALALMVPLTSMVGFPGAAYAVLAGVVLTVPFLLHFSRKLIGLTLAETLQAVIPASLLSLAVGISIQVALGLFGSLTWWTLAATVALAAATYACAAFALWKTMSGGPLGVLLHARTGG